MDLKVRRPTGRKPKPTPTPTPPPEPANPEIVYAAEILSNNKKDTTYKIMLMDSDGSHKTEVLDCGQSYCGDPTFSADGSKIIFVGDAFAPYQAIYIMDLDGSNVRELAELHDSSGQPEMSPVTIGGQYWILYSDYGPYEDIYAVNEAGDSIVQVTNTPDYTQRAPAFSADGRFFSAEMFPHLIPSEGHVFHFELDQTASFPVVTWEAATVYTLGCYQSHPSWSPIRGDYRFLVNCWDTRLYDFGSLPWEYEHWCDPDPYFDNWCRDHVFPANWPEEPINLTDGRADYGDAEFSPDALQYVYVNDNTIYRANLDKSGPHVPIAEGDRWISVYSPEWRPERAGFMGKLTASDAAEGDEFGLLFGTQAIRGDTAVIISYRDDHEGGTDVGSAYVFVRSGDTFREQQKIIGSETEDDDAFGGSTAVSEDEQTVFISALWDDHSGYVDAGSVYVFARGEDGAFIERQVLTAPEPTSDDWFGWVLANDGDTLVVGSANWEASDETGSAHVFTYSDETDTWIWQAELLASDGAPRDVFGQSVSIEDGTIAVGAPLADHAGLDNAGAAYVFTRSGDSWIEHKIVASDAESGDNFGTFVALSGDTIMVSAQWDNQDAGSVYVFTRSGDEWVEQQEIVSSDGGAGDWFGDSIVLLGDTAIISAIHNDHSGKNDVGAVYVFRRSDGVWTEQKKITADDAEDGDCLGWGVPTDDDIVLMGAALDDHSGLEDAGSVYLYRLISPPEGN